MARSYKTKTVAADEKKPPNWTEMVPHEYCGALDLGRKGRKNKTQKCSACQQVKAQLAHQVEKATKSRRSDKMSFTVFGSD